MAGQSGKGVRKGELLMIRRITSASLPVLLACCGAPRDSTSTVALLAQCEATAMLVPSSVGENLRRKAEEAARSCVLALDHDLSDSERAQATLHHGILMAYLGRRDEAIESLRAAVTLDSGRPLAHYQLGIALFYGAREMELEGKGALAKMAYGEAIIHLKEATKSDDLGHDRYAYLAMALWSAGLHEEAIDAYREDVRLNPSDRRRRIGLAWDLNFLGRHEEALAAFADADLATPATALDEDTEMTREIRAASSRGERWQGWDDTTRYMR